MIGDMQKNLQVNLFSLFQISVTACCSVGFGRILKVCCCLRCLRCLTIKDMAEEAQGRRRGTRQVYIRHVNNAEREILDILQNSDPENEEPATVLQLLRDGLTEKLAKIKAIDGSILALLDQKNQKRN